MGENVGGLLKKVANVFYLVEVIASVVGGIVLITQGDEMVVVGILTMLTGWCVALLPYLLLYGLGELIEQTAKNQENTRKILHLLENRNSQPPARGSAEAFTSTPVTKSTSATSTHVWRCPDCGKSRTQDPCEHCGGN